MRAVERGLRAGCERHGIEVHQLLCAMRGAPGAACFDIAHLVHSMRNGRLGGVVPSWGSHPHGPKLAWPGRHCGWCVAALPSWLLPREGQCADVPWSRTTP